MTLPVTTMNTSRVAVLHAQRLLQSAKEAQSHFESSIVYSCVVKVLKL